MGVERVAAEAPWSPYISMEDWWRVKWGVGSVSDPLFRSGSALGSPAGADAGARQGDHVVPIAARARPPTGSLSSTALTDGNDFQSWRTGLDLHSWFRAESVCILFPWALKYPGCTSLVWEFWFSEFAQCLPLVSASLSARTPCDKSPSNLRLGC